MSQHSFASSKDQGAMDPSPLLEGEHRVDMERPSLNTFERGSLMRASFRNSSMTSRGTAASLASVGTGAGGGASAADKAEQDLEKELTGLDDAQVAAARTEWGRNEIPEKIIPLWYMIAKQLQGPMPHMIQASTVLSAALQQWAPFAILLTIIVINTAIGFHEEKKAKDALDGLKSSMTSTVPCKRNGQVVTLDVTELVPQDVIFLRGGNIVPADCRWLEGDVFQVDTAALTGEALPRKVPSEQYGTEMLSGSVIKIGEGFCVCDKTGVHTEIGMGMAAIQENSGVEMGFFEKKIMAVVTGIIAITVVDIIVLTLYQCIERGHLLYGGEQPMLLWDLAIMVAAVPIALPLVIQVTMAIGASTMAEKKAIVTHLTALQEIASMKVLCSDKTGTLTTANMTIIADKIWCNEGFTADEVLTWAAIASNPNNKEDPIDQAVFRGFENHFGTERAAGIVGQYKIHQFMGFNPIIKRTVVKATVSSSSGGGGTKKPLVITKGLLNKVLDTRHGLDAQQLSSGETDGGELQWSVEGLAQVGPMVKDVDVQLAVKGYKTIAVAVRRPPTLDDPNGGPMVLAGIVPMLDPPRKDTAQTVYRIRDAQVDVKMITGDHLNIAKETSKLIHLGTNVLPSTALWPASATRDKLILDADGFAQVLPKDKKEVVMVLQNMGMVVGMTGDGVNDAPALAQAQIGIAVDGATEAAKAAADIILTTPGLSAIFDAVVESRRIFQRLQAYILYRMAATFQIVMVLTLLICIYDKMINPLYVILLALFNDVTMAPISSDNALPSKKPDVPTVKYIVGMSLLFGGLSTIQTMVYYHYVDVWDHPDEKGGEPLDYSAKDDDIKVHIDGETVNVWDLRSSATYVQISIAVEILIFSCRTTGWFFLDMPSWGLIAGVMIANVVVSLCAVYGVIVSPHLTWEWVANIWAYDIMWLCFIDVCKMFVNWCIGNSHSDILEYSDMPGLQQSQQANMEMRPSGSMSSRPSQQLRPSQLTNGRGSSRMRQSNVQSRLSQRYSTSDPSGAARASYAPRTSSLRPNLPQNVARDNGSVSQWGNDGDVDAWQDAMFASNRTNDNGSQPNSSNRNSNGSTNSTGTTGNTRV